eukprot:TRINITY_DN97241_c0_g1_i1.p1 TRINITY_DN97241_c0_g1~~TRINITY_DN97241_c0_g1_i1.p1  ORF type:complete len:326 (+),score=30.53 TRINITY_DN97241_c0_g1_i1:182-1159(+)
MSDKSGSGSPRSSQLRYVIAGMVLMTLQPAFVKLSQNKEGQIAYSSVGAVLMMELCKLALAAFSFFRDRGRPSVELDLKEFLAYAVPAAIYCLNNNISLVILTYLDATTFQLLGQLKTVFTAILFRLILKRQLSFYQWLAVCQLACGSAVSQIPSKAVGAVEKPSAWLGVVMMVFSCLLSAFGGIYSEKLLKEKDKRLFHWQNILLYTWGVVFNMLTMVFTDGGVKVDDFFRGYSIWTGALILNNALNGLAISAILKYADNIARVYSSTLAMLLTMIMSVVFFGESISPQLVLACCIVAMSVIQYSVKPEQLGFHESIEGNKKKD